jgi:alginate O-acetyltransferase complex protein AlgJ
VGTKTGKLGSFAFPPGKNRRSGIDGPQYLDCFESKLHPFYLFSILKEGQKHIGNRIFILLVFLSLAAFGGRALQRLLQEEPKAFKVFRIDALKETGEQFTQRLNRYMGQDTSLLYPIAEFERAALGRSFKRNIAYGQGDWFFLGANQLKLDPQQMAMGVPQLSEMDHFELALQYRQRAYWCQQHDIDYWLIVTPNKASIYPEHLSSAVPILGYTFLDSLLPILSTAVHHQLIDVRPDLLAAKKQRQVYYYTDTHWNQLGGFVGAKRVVKTLQQAGYPVALLPDSSFTIDTIPFRRGDHTRMAMLPRRVVKDFDLRVQLTAKSQRQELPIPEAYRYHKAYLTVNPEGSLPKILLFHDSFGHHLRPHLALYTQELTALWLWGIFNPRIASQEKPNIILDQIIERNLAESYPGNDGDVIQTYWEEHFGDLPSLVKKPFDKGELALQTLLKTVGRQVDGLLVVKLAIESPKETLMDIDLGLTRVHSLSLKAGKQDVYFQYNPKRSWKFNRTVGFKIHSVEVRLLSQAEEYFYTKLGM